MRIMTKQKSLMRALHREHLPPNWGAFELPLSSVGCSPSSNSPSVLRAESAMVFGNSEQKKEKR